MSNKNGNPSAGNGKPDVEALRAEIARTRADLGETVQALAAKADVKARAKEQVEQTKLRVKESFRSAAMQVRESGAAEHAQEVGTQVRRNPIPAAAVVAGVAVLIGVILIVRGRRR